MRLQQWPHAPTVTDISIAHSPDSDDAFMFYGLATNKVRVPGYRFSHTLCDIETLNRRAQNEAFFDVTAISFHAYPYVQKNYTLMGCGGSVGEGYGPMVVSLRPLTQTIWAAFRVAVPGTLTTAYLALKIFNPDIETETVPFDQIIPGDPGRQIRRRTHHPRGPAHLLHQRPLSGARPGRLVARNHRPGAAPRRQCHPPLAGRRAAQRSFPRPCATASSTRSITANRRSNTPCSLPATWIPRLANRFVSMYVNDRTLDYGADGREAIRKLLDMGHERGIIPIAPQVDFVD